MPPKAKPGQRVGHRQTGQRGTISSIVGGVANILWDRGGSSMHHTDSLHSEGGSGCGIFAAALLTLPALPAVWQIFS